MKHLFIINPAAGSRDRTEYYSQKIHEACGSRGLDYEINLPVTVSVMNLQKSPDRKGLGIEIILP
jgi:hypothetical protein